MDIDLSEDNPSKKIDFITLQKMVFIYNALDKGWTVKKNNNSYIFKKNHEGKKEVFLDDYLKHFGISNLSEMPTPDEVSELVESEDLL